MRWLPTASPRRRFRHMRPTTTTQQPTAMLRLRQASATTVHRIERALQRQPRANKNPGSRSVNSTTQDPNMSPTRGPASLRLVSRRRFSRLPSACCWWVSLWVRPATASSPVRSSSAARRAAPWTVRVRPRIGNRRRDRLPRETSPDQGSSFGSFLDLASRRPLSRGGRHTSAGMEAGRVLRGFAFAPSLD